MKKIKAKKTISILHFIHSNLSLIENTNMMREKARKIFNNSYSNIIIIESKDFRANFFSSQYEYKIRINIEYINQANKDLSEKNFRVL